MTDTTTRPAVGPELDAAVSRDVFEWTPCGKVPCSVCEEQLYPYSTDLDAAGLILERWRERGYTIEILSQEGTGLGWEIQVTHYPSGSNPTDLFTVEQLGCDTLPEAISRAALLVAEATR